MKIRRTLLLVAVVWIGGAQVVHAQCTYSVTTTTMSVLSNAGSRTVSVITGAYCSWSATSQASWITITNGTGTGLGAATFAYEANPTAAPRTGTIVVAGHTVTVTQAANSCSYMVAPSSFSISGGRATLSVDVTTGALCTWTATPSVDWITITAGETGSVLGPVTFVVSVNLTGAARTGTVAIGTRTVTINQAAPSGTPPAVPAGLKIER